MRTHFSLASSALFLTGLAAVAVPVVRGSIGPWQAAELSVYGLLLTALVYLARNLVRLRREVRSSRLRIDGQGLECGELAADDRAEVASRMDDLMERMSRAAESLAGASGPGSEGLREEVPTPCRTVDVERVERGAMAPVGDRGTGPAAQTETAGAAP
nr:hypothetical protein [Nocardiopsis xinjiangensis]